jgi:four helix bundle protein
MRDYTKIEAWKLADELTVAIYKATRSFPREEIYGVVSQIRRAACSVPANIVEGSSRESQKEYLHFLYVARGSLSETQYFIHLSQRLDFLTQPQAEDLTARTRQTFACLHGLIKAVEKESGKLPSSGHPAVSSPVDSSPVVSSPADSGPVVRSPAESSPTGESRRPEAAKSEVRGLDSPSPVVSGPVVRGRVVS